MVEITYQIEQRISSVINLFDEAVIIDRSFAREWAEERAWWGIYYLQDVILALTFQWQGTLQENIHITLNNYNLPWKRFIPPWNFTYITYQEVIKKILKLIQNSLNAKVRSTSLSKQCLTTFRKYAYLPLQFLSVLCQNLSFHEHRSKHPETTHTRRGRYTESRGKTMLKKLFKKLQKWNTTDEYLKPSGNFSFIELFKLLFVVELVHHGVHQIHVWLHHVTVCCRRQFLQSTRTYTHGSYSQEVFLLTVGLFLTEYW